MIGQSTDMPDKNCSPTVDRNLGSKWYIYLWHGTTNFYDL